LIAQIDDAVHYLPTQGPISIFVHHNTLHSFESLPFDQAVIEGGALYGCEPYWPEDRYRSEYRRGRISLADLRHSVMDDLGVRAEETIAGFGTRYTLRLAMLQMTMHEAPEAELHWLLAETDLLKRFPSELPRSQCEQMIQQTKAWVIRETNESAGGRIETTLSDAVPELIRGLQHGSAESVGESVWEENVLRLLWHVCRHGVQSTNQRRDQISGASDLHHLLRETTGVDTDQTINEILIRFCGSFLDQGFAPWALPQRDQGFAKAFANLFRLRFTVMPVWMHGIERELDRILDGPFDPLASISESLHVQGIKDDQIPAAVRHAVMGLRGWAGMIWQLETSTPWLPNPAVSGSLYEYLAIRLLLQRFAITHVGKVHFGTTDYSQIRKIAASRRPRHHGASLNQRTYRVFQLAQAIGWSPELLHGLDQQHWGDLITEIESFTSIQRRRVWHRAYERNYRTRALDAIAIHSKRRRSLDRPRVRPAFAAVFCIDDREESFRRHLEEIDPQCVTASAAGFFAVAMYYQGADHAHYRPLCPNIITPKHYVREEPVFSAVDANERRAHRRRRLGLLTHRVHAGSRTFLGGWITGVFGAVATFPMVARIMAPRLTAKIRESLGTWVRPPSTELRIERIAPQPGPAPDALGYSLEEMAAIVIRILQDTGLVSELPDLVIFFGHGSSSLNNPHESAYNCGACSGGRGGPNARAFAMMANDVRVRRLASKRGVEIPDTVRFVGAYHNTCSDKVDYYDLDLLPRTHRALFRRVEKSVAQARARNAHERARRFDSASLDLIPAAALEHVEQRSEDLSQARPEYNHATNALVFVGRRDWSRGLFVDRRVFLTSYDPRIDDKNASILTRILQAAIPVCAGISLEYYFSTVDTEGYGCGSKLPHNVTSMIGVMTGAASDLRPGLSQQMVEIHEPVRILFVVETTPQNMQTIIGENPVIATLVQGEWVQLALLDPETSAIQVYSGGVFEPYVAESGELPEVESSIKWYRGQRDHLGFASIRETSIAASETRMQTTIDGEMA
jgi:uncharacterized protein YbcC (UPF0753/DUF2309 family)